MRSDHESDAGSLGEFKEANQRYQHVDSLDQPLLSPIGDAAPVYSTYDSHELATQYVLTKITELRVMTSTHAEKMSNMMTDLYDNVVEFVQTYELYDDDRFAPNKAMSGTGFCKKVLLPEDLKTTDPRRKLHPSVAGFTAEEDWIPYKKTVLGDGQCNWRSDSLLMFDTEYYWEHIRLATMFFAQHTNPTLHNHGDKPITYGENVLNDLNGRAEVTSGAYPPWKDWEFIPYLLEGKDPAIQAGILETAVSSVLFDSNFVCLVQTAATTKGKYTECNANVVSCVRAGVFLNADSPIPHLDHAFWKINSPGNNDVWHFDPVVQIYSPAGKAAAPVVKGPMKGVPPGKSEVKSGKAGAAKGVHGVQPAAKVAFQPPGKSATPSSGAGSWEMPSTPSPKGFSPATSFVQLPMNSAVTKGAAKTGKGGKKRHWDDMLFDKGLGSQNEVSQLSKTPVTQDFAEQYRIDHLKQIAASASAEAARREQEALKLKTATFGRDGADDFKSVEELDPSQNPVQAPTMQVPTFGSPLQPTALNFDQEWDETWDETWDESWDDEEGGAYQEAWGGPDWGIEQWDDYLARSAHKAAHQASPAAAAPPSIFDMGAAKASKGTSGPGGASSPGGDPSKGQEPKGQFSSQNPSGKQPSGLHQDPDEYMKLYSASRSKYYEFYDEKPGAKIELTHKLTNFKPEFEVGKSRQLKKYITEVHLPDAMATMPGRPREIKEMYQHGLSQHTISVNHPDARESHVTFQAPDTSAMSQMQKNWRIRFLSALLVLFPPWVKDRLYDLCRNNGRYSADRVDGSASKKNVFEPDDEVHFLEESEFWCPEAVYYILLMSCYSGRGHERTAITKYIAPPFKESEQPSTIPWKHYKAEFKAWNDVVQMAQKFGIALGDPVNIMKLYKGKFLGGDNKNGVLAQFEDLQHMWKDFRIKKNVTAYHADQSKQGFEDISEFHHKVLSFIEHEQPDHPETAPTARNVQPGSKGKGDKNTNNNNGKGGKGKKGKKGKGKNGKGKKGKGKGGGKSHVEWTPDQWKEYCSHVCSDGFRLGLCWDFVEFGKCSKPRGECQFAKYGGHPGPTEITEGMRAAIAQRRARFAQKWANNGKGNARQPAQPTQQNNHALQPFHPNYVEHPNYVPHWAQYYSQMYQNQQLALPPPPPVGANAVSQPIPPAGALVSQQALHRPPTAPQAPMLPATYSVQQMHEDRVIANKHDAPRAQREAAEARMKLYLDNYRAAGAQQPAVPDQE